MDRSQTHFRRDFLKLAALSGAAGIAGPGASVDAKDRLLIDDAGHAGRSSPELSFLKTSGRQIVDGNGKVMRLRGVCVGGWMNMEDFINGHPGAEHTLRAEMSDALGPAKAHFFFERLLDHFFNEDDVIFLRRTGANVVRLPLNYRHFEDDISPFTYKEAGFARLDQVLRWCEKHRLYVILDLHAAQGWQNAHWHCDNASRISLLWENRTYQDRFVALWQEFARRYKNSTVVAGYNILNEPCTNNPRGDYPWNISRNYRPDWGSINSLYKRTVSQIRKIDDRHIIFLEGDNYSSLFQGLDAPFAESLVYSSHNYTAAGFGPGRYPGAVKSRPTAETATEQWDMAKQEAAFNLAQGTAFTRKHDVPLWIGEFGAPYNGASSELDDRYRALDDQIDVFERYRVSWTTWTYKDVGVMGMQTLHPNSPYMALIRDLLGKKAAVGADDWMSWLPGTPVKDATASLAGQIRTAIGDPRIDARMNVRCLSQALLCFYTGTLMQPLYVRLFKGLSENDLDKTLSSFSIRQCVPNERLVSIMSKHMTMPA